MIHSVMVGIMMGPDEKDCHHEDDPPCSRFNDFTVYKAAG